MDGYDRLRHLCLQDSGELLRKDIETVRERGSAVPIVLRTLRHEANAALPKL